MPTPRPTAQDFADELIYALNTSDDWTYDPSCTDGRVINFPAVYWHGECVGGAQYTSPKDFVGGSVGCQIRFASEATREQRNAWKKFFDAANAKVSWQSDVVSQIQKKSLARPRPRFRPSDLQDPSSEIMQWKEAERQHRKETIDKMRFEDRVMEKLAALVQGKAGVEVPLGASDLPAKPPQAERQTQSPVKSPEDVLAEKAKKPETRRKWKDAWDVYLEMCEQYKRDYFCSWDRTEPTLPDWQDKLKIDHETTYTVRVLQDIRKVGKEGLLQEIE
jgi:hypothetical protein